MGIFIIAEVAQAHEGSLGIAHSYIDALAETGVDAVKFQTHIAHAESSVYEPFRVQFSYEDVSRFDYWKRMEFTFEQWLGLKQHCEEKGLEFISSPFSNVAVDLLENLGVKRYKIGSGEVNNYLMLEKVARTGKPILISSGLSSFNELDKAISILKTYKNALTVLQCTSSYPTQPEQWGLNLIPVLKERYQLPVGFSDHSGDIFASIVAASFGASVLEFHVVFDKRMFGPDTKSSLTIEQISQLVKGVRQIERSQSIQVDKNQISDLIPLKLIFEKSLAVNKNMNKGDKIRFDDLEAKKPKGRGIDATDFRRVIGKTINNDIPQWSFLNKEDIDG